MDADAIRALILESVLLPAGIALAVLVPWALLGRRRDRAALDDAGAAPADPVRGSWVAALAFGLALFPATALAYGQGLTFPPADGVLWAVYGPAFGAVLGIVLVLTRSAWWVRWPVALAGGVALAIGVLWNPIAWPGEEVSRFAPIVVRVWHAVAVGLALGVMWIGVDSVLRRASAVQAGVALWVVASIASQAFVASGVALTGNQAASLAAVLGAVVVAGMIRPSLSVAAGAPALVALYGACLVSATFFPDGATGLPFVGQGEMEGGYPVFAPPPSEQGGLAGVSIVLLWLAPVAPLAGVLFVRETKARTRLFVMAAVGAIVAGAAMAPMGSRLLELVEPPEEAEYDPYG